MFRVENLKNISSSYTFWPKKKTFRFTLSLLRLFSKWGKVKQDIAFSLKTKHLKLFFSQRLNNYQIIIKLKSQCLKDVRTTLLISDLVNPALNDASLSLKNRTDQQLRRISFYLHTVVISCFSWHMISYFFLQATFFSYRPDIVKFHGWHCQV